MGWVSRLLLCVAVILLVEEIGGKHSHHKHSKSSKKSKKDAIKGSKRMSRCHRLMGPLQEDISELQHTVRGLASPVHVHLHGGSDGDGSVSSWSTGGQDHAHPQKHGRGHSRTSTEDKDAETEMDGRESHVHIHLNMAYNQPETSTHDHSSTQAKDPAAGYPKDEYVHAKCDMVPNSAYRSRSRNNVRGSVYLRQKPNSPLEVKMQVLGVDDPGRGFAKYPRKGFHVHAFGDFSDGCQSFGGHYNPGGHSHGGPDSGARHVGDWGNVDVDPDGVIMTTFTRDAYIYGPQSIIGRGLVLHEGEDDHGHGGTESSRKTGSAGARLACCVICHYDPSTQPDAWK